MVKFDFAQTIPSLDVCKNDEGETFKEEERELGDWDKVEEIINRALGYTVLLLVCE